MPRRAGCWIARRRASSPSRTSSSPTSDLSWAETMPIATPEQYAEMLDSASAGGYALAAVNVSSSQTLNAVMRGFAEAGADGIVQISTGGGEYLSGGAVKDMALGAQALAEYA